MFGSGAPELLVLSSWIAALVWAATAVSSDSKGAWQSSSEQRFCAQCGAFMRIDTSFCAQCGAKRS